MFRFAVIVGALLVCAAAGILAQYRHPLFLPRSRGPYAVREVDFLWSDVKHRPDLAVQVWYPEDRSGKLPLLLLSPAMARVPKDYSVITRDLASYGYIVAGVTPGVSAHIDLEHRDALQPVVERWATELQFALDRLERQPLFRERLNAARIGVFGHSFGGAVALHLLAADGRFRRAANLDGALEGHSIHLDRPALILLGASFPPALKSLNDRILGEIDEVCRSNSAPCRIENHPEAQHMNFADGGVSALHVPVLMSHYELGSIDGLTFLHQVTDRLKRFFDEM